MADNMNAGDLDEKRLLSYVIEKLREAKNDSERISLLFLMMKLDPTQIIKSKKVIELYIALSPSFIFRLLNSSQTEPMIEEIELGLEILSFFVMFDPILHQKEMKYCIEASLDVCKHEIVNKSACCRKAIFQIVSCGFKNSSDRKNIKNEHLLNFINILEHCDCSELSDFVSLFSKLIRSTTSSETINEILFKALSIFENLSIERKAKFFDLILEILEILIKFQIPIVTSNWKPLSNVLVHFLLSSNPIHNKAVELSAVIYQCVSFEIFFEKIVCLQNFKLFLNLCLMEIELCCDKIDQKQSHLEKLPKNIEACCIIVEAFLIYYFSHNENLTNELLDIMRIDKFRANLLSFLKDAPPTFSAASFLKLACVTWNLFHEKIEMISVYTFNEISFKFLSISDVEIEPFLWLAPFLNQIPNFVELYPSFTLNDDFIEIFINYTLICVDENFLTDNYQKASELILNLYKILEFFVPLTLLNAYESLLKKTVTFKLESIKLFPRIIGLLYACVTKICLHVDCLHSGWINYVISINLKTILDTIDYKYLFLEQFLKLVKKSNHSINIKEITDSAAYRAANQETLDEILDLIETL